MAYRFAKGLEDNGVSAMIKHYVSKHLLKKFVSDEKKEC